MAERARTVAASLQASSLADLSVEPSTEELVSRLAVAEAAVDELVKIFAAGAPWVEGDQVKSFGLVLERLTSYTSQFAGTFYECWAYFRYYPALRIFYAGGISSLKNGNYQFLKYMTTALRIPERYGGESDILGETLNVPTVFYNKLGNLLPDKSRHFTPGSDNLHDSLKPYLLHFFLNDEDYTRGFDRFEYLLALIVGKNRLKQEHSWFWAPLGSFLWRDSARVRSRLSKEILDQGEDWPAIKAGLFSSSEEVKGVIEKAEEHALKARGGW